MITKNSQQFGMRGEPLFITPSHSLFSNYGLRSNIKATCHPQVRRLNPNTSK